jgi:hypothetical protein
MREKKKGEREKKRGEREKRKVEREKRKDEREEEGWESEREGGDGGEGWEKKWRGVESEGWMKKGRVRANGRKRQGWTNVTAKKKRNIAQKAWKDEGNREVCAAKESWHDLSALSLYPRPVGESAAPNLCIFARSEAPGRDLN